MEYHAEAGPTVAALTGYSSKLQILVCGNTIAVLFGDNINP